MRRLVRPEMRRLVRPEMRRLVRPEMRRLVRPEMRRLVRPEMRRLVRCVVLENTLALITRAGDGDSVRIRRSDFLSKKFN
jgi:hypothetical protein